MKRFAVLLALSLSLGFVTSAAVPPPEKLLPTDTLFVMTVPDMTKANSIWKQSPSSRLWNDAALKPFKDKFLAKFKTEVTEPLEKELGIKFADYTQLAQGQLTVAVTQNGWDGRNDNDPAVLVLLDARDQRSLLQTNLAALKKKWVDAGKQLKTEKIRDVEFTTLMFSSEDLGKAFKKVFSEPGAADRLDDPAAKKVASKQQLTFGQADSVLIIGNVPKEIEKVVAHLSGGTAPSLIDHSAFAANHTALFRDCLGYGWVNLKTLVDNLTAGLKEKSGNRRAPEDIDPEKILTAFGLKGMKTLAWNYREMSEGALVSLHLGVPESGRKGLFKAFAFDAKEAVPPPYVPADATKFSRWRLDARKAIETIEAMATEMYPQAGGVIKMVMESAGKDKDPNFDLRKSLIDNLGDDLISIQKAPRNNTFEELGSPPTLFLLGSRNAEQMTAAIKVLAGLVPGANKLKEREFLGRKIFSVPFPTMAPGGKVAERSLNFAASGGYLAISLDNAMLEEYLRGENKGKRLSETAGLAEAAEKVGGTGTGLFGYDNQSETMRAALETLKKDSGALANLFGASPLSDHLGLGDGGKKLKEWTDFSLLPSWDKIAKYFYYSVYAGTINSEGLTMKIFAPTPPQLKK